MTEKLTQEEKIIHYMKEHGSITALEAMQKLYITQFHARMNGLRNRGYVFTEEREKNHRTNTKWNRYRIAKKPKKA